MKSIIIEIKDGYAAVLSDDGCLTKIKNKNYIVGQEIDLIKSKYNQLKKFIVFAASAAIFTLSFGTGIWAYASPYSYVSLDVNPSFEYTVNRFNRVIKIKAMNDDGKDILKDTALKDINHSSIKKAVLITLDQLTEEGYFDDNNMGAIVITTYNTDDEKSEQLAQSLKNDVEEEWNQNQDNVIVETTSIQSEQFDEATELGVSPGKLTLVKKLLKNSSNSNSIDIKEWLNKPVKEIMKAIRDSKKDDKLISNDSNDSVIMNEDSSDSTESKENLEDTMKDEIEDISDDSLKRSDGANKGKSDDNDSTDMHKKSSLKKDFDKKTSEDDKDNDTKSNDNNFSIEKKTSKNYKIIEKKSNFKKGEILDTANSPIENNDTKSTQDNISSDSVENKDNSDKNDNDNLNSAESTKEIREKKDTSDSDKVTSYKSDSTNDQDLNKSDLDENSSSKSEGVKIQDGD